MNKVILIFLIFIANFTFAQDPYSIHYNESNGLASNVVYSIFQDKSGYVWSAGDQGLSRFDGKKWLNFKAVNQNSISGSLINEDEYGRIWYENFDGYLFYVYNNKIHSLQQNKPFNFINYGLTKAHLFVIQKKGIDVYDLKSLKIIKTFLFDTKFLSASCSNGFDFVLFFQDKIMRFNNHLKVEIIPYFMHKPDIITSLFWVNNKFIAKVLEQNKIKVLEFSNNLKTHKSITINTNGTLNGIKSINKNYWFQTSKGLFISDALSVNKARVFFKEKNISNVICDRQGNYWVSTTNEGIFLIPNLDNLAYSIENYAPSQFEKVENKIIIANTKGALFQFDANLKFEKKNFQHPFKEEIYYFEYDSIYKDICFSSLGFTHIPKFDYKNPFLYEFATKKIKRIDEKYAFIGTSTFFGMIQLSKKGKSSWDKLFKIDPIHKNIFVIQSSNRVRTIAFLKEKEKVFWASNNGFFSFDKANGIQEIKHQNASFFVKNLHEFQDNVYVLSAQEKLFKVDSNNKLVNITSSFDFESNKIQKIQGFQNKLVVLGNENIFLVNLKNNQSTKINIPILTKEIKDVLYHNNQLLFLTKGKIIRVIDYLNEKKTKGLFHINEVQIANKLFAFDKKIVLQNKQYNIKIDYSILDFGSVITNELFYRINAKEWIKLDDANRQLQLVLNEGKFEIEFKLNNTIQSDKIRIEVEVPFWKRFEYIILFVILLSIVSYIYYKLQIKKLQLKNTILTERNKLLEDKIQLERNLKKSILTTVKSQMNPHFFYNALNTIQAYIFNNDKTTASNYLSKFSKLTRLVLEMSEQETILLNDEVQALRLYLDLEKMRFQEAFEYQLIYDENALNTVEIPSMIIQPYVENAIKHGLLHKKDGVGKIKINFVVSEKELLVEIEDNGVGRKRSLEINQSRQDKSKSFATNANKKRLDILNEGKTDKIVVQFIDNFDKQNQPKGTTVKLIIPLNYDL